MQAHILVDGEIRRTDRHDEVQQAHAVGRTMWIDLGERTPETAALLADTFKIHPLVVEDIWFERTVPKVDVFADYLYVIVHGVKRDSRPTQVALYVLDVIIGKSFIITEHQSPLASEAIRAQTPHLEGLLQQGPAWVAHAVIDTVIDRFVPFVDDMGAQIEAMERQMVDKTGSDDGGVLATISGLKRSLQILYRIANHQRDTLRELAYGNCDAIPPAAMPYFRDINDHFIRVWDLIEAYRDVMANAVESYLNLQSKHMNESIKTLTSISTMLLPLSFIAAVYGMNFRVMPEISWRYGYAYALTLMVVVATVLLVWLKRRKLL